MSFVGGALCISFILIFLPTPPPSLPLSLLLLFCIIFLSIYLSFSLLPITCYEIKRTFLMNQFKLVSKKPPEDTSPISTLLVKTEEKVG